MEAKVVSVSCARSSDTLQQTAKWASYVLNAMDKDTHPEIAPVVALVNWAIKDQHWCQEDEFGDSKIKEESRDNTGQKADGLSNDDRPDKDEMQ